MECRDRKFSINHLKIKTVDTQSYKTVSLKAGDIKKEWVLIDATDLVLGRLASRVALVLRGKNKPSYTPHMDCGDNVIIVNADKIKLTGNKLTDKVYSRALRYPGGQRFTHTEGDSQEETYRTFEDGRQRHAS